MNNSAQKINAFRHLKTGWHYGQGHSFDERVLQETIHLHAQIVACGFADTDAFPGIDGSISLTVYTGTECLEFTCMPEGTMQYRRESDDVEESITLPQTKNILETFQREIC